MKTERWVHIDSIRGLAAIAVIYFHTAEFAHKRGLDSSRIENFIFTILVDYVDLGKVAVALFFAVSGFVIPFSLLRPQTTPLRNFVVSRFFRLYPAYWVSVLLALVFLFAMQGKSVSTVNILANITMLQQFVGQENLIGVYWTLQIELIFYAVSAAMFAINVLQKPRAAFWASVFFIICALALAVVRFILEKKLPVALPLALSVMFWGLSWRYRLAPGASDQDRKLSLGLTAILLVMVPIISILAYNVDQGFGETWYRYTLSYYSAIGLFVLLTTKVRITNPLFVKLGLISYSIYLLGPIAQVLVQNAIGVDRLAHIPIHLVILVATLVTIAAAWLVYRFVEHPSQNLAKRLTTMRSVAPEAI